MQYPVVVYQFLSRNPYNGHITSERIGKVGETLEQVLARFKANKVKVWNVSTVETMLNQTFYKVVVSKQ